MNFFRVIARPLVATGFVLAGVDQLRNSRAQAEALRSGVLRLSKQTGFLPDDPQLYVRANAAVLIGGGALLALGRMPAATAATLALASIPQSYAQQKVASDPHLQGKPATAPLLSRNLLLIGGALLAAVDATATRKWTKAKARRAHREAEKMVTSVARSEARAAADKAAKHITVSA